MNQQTTAPPSCRACGYVVLVSITQGQRVERYDRCIPKPGRIRSMSSARGRRRDGDAGVSA